MESDSIAIINIKHLSTSSFLKLMTSLRLMFIYLLIIIKIDKKKMKRNIYIYFTPTVGLIFTNIEVIASLKLAPA